MVWFSLAIAIIPLAFFWCCCVATCDRCQANPSDDIEVVISGLTNDGCTSCGSLDGTYVLTRITASTPDFVLAPGSCAWLYYFTGSPSCDEHFLFLEISNPSVVKVEVGMAFTGGFSGKRIYWVANPASTSTGPGSTQQIDCDFAALSVPFDRYFNPGVCIATGSTATITAL